MPLSDFVVKESLGKGSFGDVKRVVRKADGKQYAMKEVPVGNLSRKEVKDAVNEVRLLASLRHPSVIGFLEAFFDRRTECLCTVMEFADRGDLSSLIKKAKEKHSYIPETQVWQYFIQMMEGMKYLHSHSIMHRDMKTGNVFLTKSGQIKIGDMNVSKLSKRDLAHTQIGTPYYLSPEIWKNRPYSSKSDMWACGCILYEMCALRVPFRGNSFDELSRRVQAGSYSAVPRHYSRGLRRVIQLLLSHKPKHRPSALQALQLPEVIAARRELESIDEMSIHLASCEDRELLKTIKVPHNLARLTRNLPKPCYPGDRPNSPESWPASSNGRFDSIFQQKKLERKQRRARERERERQRQREYEQISQRETGSSSSSHSSGRSASSRSSASSASSAVPSLPSIQPPKPGRKPNKSRRRKEKARERTHVEDAENLNEYRFNMNDAHDGGENSSINGRRKRHRDHRKQHNHRAPLASIPSEAKLNCKNVKKKTEKGVKVFSPTANIRMKKVPQMTGGYSSRYSRTPSWWG